MSSICVGIQQSSYELLTVILMKGESYYERDICSFFAAKVPQ
jgi:hypothetical protein